MSVAVSFQKINSLEPAPPVFADSAADRVRVLQEKPEYQGMAFRVYVTGGGCSGFQYGFKFDTPADDDLRLENGGVEMVVDPMSLKLLAGANIEYTVNLQGAQFVVSNPNVATTCGCGASFSI